MVGKMKNIQTGFTPFRNIKNICDKFVEKVCFLRKTSRNQKFLTGFTLIELVVVVAIIGILSSIAVISFKGQTAKARDAKRKADLATLQQALEGYYEVNGKYPTCDNVIEAWLYEGVSPNPPNDSNLAWNSIYRALVPKYIGNIPLDPKYNGSFSGGVSVSLTRNAYMYYPLSANGGLQCSEEQRYSLWAKLETSTWTNPDANTVTMDLSNADSTCLTAPTGSPCYKGNNGGNYYAKAFGYNYRVGN
ncbi:MAG: putative General secretion pathway protein GspG [Candidatus Berkelbacteria bacterium Licking1014_7]|uniref:Putative General secretion pathway protein GspG n=1 Tax=Candidatus Berkelbacteria bacterium Licking1014_7 TaxID=2017147 RepID=A0A554LKR8_9BACT|nr:MAG: putative General secretion pathway protein GspG [Candidatus Berkelbacteria bacterium Licking1014_7]